MKKVEELLKIIDEDIKEILSEKRYNHSKGVMKKAEELAIRYNVDVEKAKIVGLAHDIAKELTKEEKLKYVEENDIQIDNVESVNIELLHGKIGADICKKKYGFTQDMQDAIKYHTTGNIDMDDLAKVIYIADKTEDGRTFEDLEHAKTLANKSIDEALIYIIDVSLIRTIEKRRLIHPDSIYLRNKLINENE